MMKHSKKTFKKISKPSIKKGASILVILFFAMSMIFQKDMTNTEVQFVRNSDEDLTHNAANEDKPASQRDYLFQNEAGNEVYQGQITDGQRRTETTPPATKENEDTTISKDGIIPSTETIITGTIITGKTYTGNGSGIEYIGTQDIGTQIIQKTGIINTIITNTGSDCITPWKETVKNKDFVLAYQQRKDVNTICNIEKRVCTEGILGGTFTQSSCKEDSEYVYRKAEVISYNQKVLNEYIQPAAPIHSGAEFNNEGKINTSEQAIDTRGTTNSPVITQKSIAQSPVPAKKNCTTPRGQSIKHGQFIKGYQAPRGFIDLPCTVEIRACINGNLKGTFNYSTCTFNNTSYAEYIKAGLPKSNKGFLFFERISSVFKD